MFQVELDGKTVNIVREVDGGLEKISLTTPAVLSTDLRLNEPRYATLPNIMKAKKKELKKVSVADLGVDITPRVEILSVEEPPQRQGGSTVPDVDTLLEKLKEGGFIK